MALQVAEGAVVGDDLEAVAQRLEAAPRAVAAVAALADEIAEQRRALDDAELGDRARVDALADPAASNSSAASRSSSSPSTCSSVTDGPP